MRIFKTFNPKSTTLLPYISYYYLDVATDDNYFNEYICYPHFNYTISLYQSHVSTLADQHTTITYQEGQKPLQLFTPLREQVLKVTQHGPVHKIAVVFNPLGLQQFSKQDAIGQKIQLIDFFSKQELLSVFATTDIDHITDLLDSYLISRFQQIEKPYLEKAISLFHTSYDDLSIEDLAENTLGISRKQLNRQFQKHIGTSAQKYRSIVRFRQLMDYKLKSKNTDNFTALSHKAHYTDQSHFIKSCKQLTGLTPSQFFKDGKLLGAKDIFWNFNTK